MNWVRIAKALETLKGEIRLPSSKSISNRVLLIRAIGGYDFPIYNLSVADDTLLLRQVLSETENELYINTENAGTVMRFCTAYFAINPGKDVVLTGSARMKKRPIGPLVDALNSLGAEVVYREKKGFPPLHVSDKRLDGGHVVLDASESSQFATALLLIAPAMPKGLELELKGELASKSYLEMTLSILNEFGVKYKVEGNTISVNRQPIIPRPYTVEGDWSSAGYWYGMASLFVGAQISFPHLYEESLQGDSLIRSLMANWFGVSTAFDRQKAWIAKSGPAQEGELHLDMLSTPDLIPTVITLCCLHKVPFTIQGTSTLRHKESDRAEALKTELGKLGHELVLDDNSIICKIFGEAPQKPVNLNTWNDHRLAMCWAMLAAKNPNIWIENPSCVQKSYPNFWNDLQGAGFSLEYRK